MASTRARRSSALATTLNPAALGAATDAGLQPIAPPRPPTIEREAAAERAQPQAVPVPSFMLEVSGLYDRAKPRGPGLPPILADEFRLDVDGRYPQMTASGVVRGNGPRSLHWIAALAPAGANAWTGAIWHKDGNTALLPQTAVEIRATPSTFPLNRKAEIVFSGAAGPAVTHEYRFKSVSFDPVEFEFDATADAAPALAIGTHDHPNRPADLPDETLSVETVYRRAGFAATVSPASGTVPLATGTDGVWSDTEMHDAMQAHWSRFANRADWALWVLHARLHEQGNTLGGIMFDDIGPNHRQGTAVFTDSFIKDAPAGDANPQAWIARMRFWTLCHEMGHAFNLAHAWQKALGTPWIPLQNEPESRSFMNYPFNVAGGQTAFFSDFQFRFSDQELLFMRHAPRRFVQMGNADWFDDHGFEESAVLPEPSLALEVRVHRKGSELTFLEPAMVELKATNVSGKPMVVDAHLLEDAHHLTLVLKRDRRPARAWRPFTTVCHEPAYAVLHPGQSLYYPLFVGAGTNGWDVAEPGWYTVQAGLHLETGEDIVSNALRLRVAPPRGYEEEHVAQDVFTDGVGRVLAFDGTREALLLGASDTLRDAAERLPDRPIAKHAQVALALPLRRQGKVLRNGQGRKAVESVAPKPDAARAMLAAALLQEPGAAAATLGHIEYRGYVETFAGWLAAEGEMADARRAVAKLEGALEQRGVKAGVLQEIREYGETLGGAPRDVARAANDPGRRGASKRRAKRSK